MALEPIAVLAYIIRYKESSLNHKTKARNSEKFIHQSMRYFLTYSRLDGNVLAKYF